MLENFWKDAKKSLKKCWKIVEKVWKNVEKSLKKVEKSWKKCWKSFENMLKCHVMSCQLWKTAQQDN